MKFFIAVLVIMLLGGRAAADPTPVCTDSNPCHLRMRESTTVTKDDGKQYRLPPGHFYDEPTWTSLDTEIQRLQQAETRYKAENQSLRGAVAGWQPGWLTVTTVLVLGFTAGVGGYYYIEHR